MLVLGTELASSGTTASATNWAAISPAPEGEFLMKGISQSSSLWNIALLCSWGHTRPMLCLPCESLQSSLILFDMYV